jgi:hypothetical protein
VTETLQIIVAILLLIAVYILTQLVVGWRIRRAAAGVVKDLERRGATGAEAAADLPYARASLLRFGLRDFRPKAVEALVRSGIVGQTAEGKYFLKKPPHELRL